MGLGKRLKKKYRKYKDKIVDVVAKVDPIVGAYQAKKESDSSDFSAPAADQYGLKDVARSRAAGSGVFNYTDQEMKKL